MSGTRHPVLSPALLQKHLSVVAAYLDAWDGPLELRTEVSSLGAALAGGAISPELRARVALALREAESLRCGNEWDRTLRRVVRQSEQLGESSLAESWSSLRAALGNRVWQGPIGKRLGDTVDFMVRGHARLGQILDSLSGQDGYAKLIERLVGPDDNGMTSALEELGVLWHLKERGARVKLLHARGDGETADLEISLDGATTEVEISGLGSPATVDAALKLSIRLEERIRQVTLSRGIALFVEVECAGEAGSLLRGVERAIEQFESSLGLARPWVRELAPGLTFSVSEGSIVAQTYVHGATVYSADPGAPESVLSRLARKVEAHESPQVSDGGVVLIVTSELSIRASQTRAAEYEPLLLREVADQLLDVGRRCTNVGAFLVVDGILGDDRTADHNVGPHAEVIECSLPAGRERLLIVPNPEAVRPVDRRVLEFFRPPLSLYF